MLGFYLAIIETPEDKKAFEKLYKEYKSIMYNTAYKIIKDEYLAEDAVHNAFMSLIKNFKKINKMNCNEMRNYLLIINRNAAYAVYNDLKKNTDIDDYVEFVSDEDIELSYEISENIEKIFNTIMSIEKKYSDVLVLKFFYNMKDNEIANALNITVENTRIRIFRGRNKIKSILNKEEENDWTWIWYAIKTGDYGTY